MTERAKRAVEELKRRGWQIDTSDDGGLDKECQQCGYQMRANSRFCQNCGTRVTVNMAESSLADIEAAISAAVDGAVDGAPEQTLKKNFNREEHKC